MQRVYRALALFAGVLVVGGVLFRSIERLDWFDAFYTALLSVTPLGHGLMPPLSRAGRQLNAFLLVCGVGVVGYAASIATRFVFEGEMGRVFWRRKVERRVGRMEGHYVVCGHGRVGRTVAERSHRKESRIEGVEPVEALDRPEENPSEEENRGEEGERSIKALHGAWNSAGSYCRGEDRKPKSQISNSKFQIRISKPGCCCRRAKTANTNLRALPDASETRGTGRPAAEAYHGRTSSAGGRSGPSRPPSPRLRRIEASTMRAVEERTMPINPP